MTQSLNDESKRHIEQVAGEALAQLESIAEASKSKLLDGRKLGSDALASINTMTSRSAIQNLDQISQANRESYQVLAAEPAIARKIYSSAFPLVDITVVPDDEIMQHRKMALLELIQKHIRQRDLLGLVDQIVSLLVTGNTNDRQLKALFNYVLQTGDAQRFRAFIGEIAERAPQEKEKLMTIADRLREEGAMQGKHEEALRIAQEMLDRGLDRELVMMVTRLSPDDLIAQSH